MGCISVLKYFDISRLTIFLDIQKSKLYKTLDYQRYTRFYFLGKGLGIVSATHFVCDFSRNMFLMLYSLNIPNFIA